MLRSAFSWSPLAVLLMLAACAGDDDASPPSPPPPAADDPFAPQPDTSEGLTNVSADLDAVLEHGTLAGACDAYAATPDDRRARLLCGKAMFFYEGYGTAGVPTPLATWLLDHFPDEVGPGFEKLGMVADPTSPAHLPLGFGPGAKLGSVEIFYMAGAPIPPSVCEAFVHQGVKPQNIYGMTENSSHQYTHPGDDNLTITATCGRGGKAYEVRLFDPADDNREVPAGTVADLHLCALEVRAAGLAEAFTELTRDDAVAALREAA